MAVDFYPRSHVGNDSRLPSSLLWSLYFYPRSHVGNDKMWDLTGVALYDFYPRSHVGNDRWMISPPAFTLKFLSTFPRRERRVPERRSIRCDRYFYPRSHVGNDTRRHPSFEYPSHFYPRSHVGNDDNAYKASLYGSDISIHVPT